MEQFLQQLEKQVRFGFGSRQNERKTNKPYGENDTLTLWEAATFMADIINSIGLCLSIQIFQPLLRNDLSFSEIFAERFHCVDVILHELAVSPRSLPPFHKC
jgi:hypothetical protein